MSTEDHLDLPSERAPRPLLTRRRVLVAVLALLAITLGVGTALVVNHRQQVALEQAQQGWTAARQDAATSVKDAQATVTAVADLPLNGDVVATLTAQIKAVQALSVTTPTTTKALEAATANLESACTDLGKAHRKVIVAQEAHVLSMSAEAFSVALETAGQQVQASRAVLTSSEGQVDDDGLRVALSLAIDGLEGVMNATVPQNAPSLDHARADLEELTAALVEAHQHVEQDVNARVQRLAAEAQARAQEAARSATSSRSSSSGSGSSSSSSSGSGSSSGQGSSGSGHGSSQGSTSPTPAPAPSSQSGGGWSSSQSWDPGVTCVLDTEGNQVCS